MQISEQSRTIDTAALAPRQPAEGAEGHRPVWSIGLCPQAQRAVSIQRRSVMPVGAKMHVDGMDPLLPPGAMIEQGMGDG